LFQSFFYHCIADEKKERKEGRKEERKEKKRKNRRKEKRKKVSSSAVVLCFFSCVTIFVSRLASLARFSLGPARYRR
jgi:hypothetical protein